MTQQLNLFTFIDNETEPTNLEQEQTKVCRTCQEEKPITNFQIDRGAVYSRCKTCTSEAAKELRDIKKKAPEKPVDGKCECCKRVVEELSRTHWYCDHWHKTGEFRGWICFFCNAGLGFLGDDKQGIVQALTYIIEKENETQ